MVWIMQDGVVRKVVGNDVEQFRENTGACISCTSTYYQKVYHVLSWRIVLRVVVVTKTTESVLVSVCSNVSRARIIPSKHLDMGPRHCHLLCGNDGGKCRVGSA